MTSVKSDCNYVIHALYQVYLLSEGWERFHQLTMEQLFRLYR